MSYWASPQWGQRSFLRASRMADFVTSLMSLPSSFVRSSMVRYFSFSSSVSSSREQLRQVPRRRRRMSFVNPTWMTGAASSMWPKWPLHEPECLPQVLHSRPGSMTPSRGSISPMSMGKPSSSYVSAVMILVADISRYSSGSISPKLISPISLDDCPVDMLDCVLQFQSRCDAQRLHFVEQELERVRHLYLVDVGLLVAVRTVDAV